MTETLPATTTAGDVPQRDTVLARGASVGRYLVIDCVGRGGMGVVYKAYDPDLDRRIAIKLVRPDSRNAHHKQRLRARLMREAQTLARLSHRNVVSVYDVGVYGDGAFVAMELIDGITLAAMLDEQPPPAGIVELFVEAGRGLAAAHAVGIVHCDFKPQNVIVGHGGIPRVLDFGIARALREDDEPPGTPTTEPGTMLGTPAYMAPEQIVGGEIDERTDQFSFCVALYQALFETLPAADPAVIPSGTPSGVRVPPRLRAALKRGLSGDRTARFDTMDELLDGLSMAPRRRWPWLAGAAVVVVGLAAFAAIRGNSPSELCAVSDSQLVGAWDPPRKAAVHDALLRTTDTATAATVERLFDRYAADWLAMRESSCRATRVVGEQSEELLDLRTECLDHRLAELGELSSLLATAQAPASRRAIDSVRALSPIDDCANTTALRDPVPPRDPARSRVLRDSLAKLEVRFSLASYAEVATQASLLATAAEQAGDRWLHASALYLAAKAVRELGHTDDAEEQLYRVVATAESARASDVAVRGWMTLAWIAGEDRGRPGDGLRLATIARGVFDRIGGSPRLEATLEDHIGSLYLGRGDLDHARQHLESALALDAKLGEDSEYAVVLQHIAMLEAQAGQPEKAVEIYRHALKLADAELGARHPTVLVIAGAEAATLDDLGRYDEAIALVEPALALAEPESDIAASLLVNLGFARWKTKRLDDAKVAFTRGLAIANRRDPHAPRTATLELDLALVLLDTGDLDGARGHATTAAIGFERHLGADHVDVAKALDVAAQAELRASRPANAIAPLERELAILMGARSPANDIAATRFDLAKAVLAARHDTARARTLAETARTELQGVGDADGVREVTAWLRQL